MKKLVVDRKTWLRGEGPRNSRLLREEDQTMCCLGFYAIACGLSSDDITDAADPPDCLSTWPDEARWLFSGPRVSGVCAHLIHQNDSRMDETKRERIIAAIFADNGVEVEFKN